MLTTRSVAPLAHTGGASGSSVTALATDSAAVGHGSVMTREVPSVKVTDTSAAWPQDNHRFVDLSATASSGMNVVRLLKATETKAPTPRSAAVGDARQNAPLPEAPPQLMPGASDE
jgi:hypothetical protein